MKCLVIVTVPATDREICRMNRIMTVLYVSNILMFKITLLKPAGIFAMISWRQRQTFLPVRYAEIFELSSQGASKQKSMVVVRVEGEVTKWYAGS